MTKIDGANFWLAPQQTINMLHTISKNPILTPSAELMLTALMPTTKNSIEEKLEITTRTFQRNPDSYKVYKQITFLALNNQIDNAVKLLQQAARAYPDKLPRYIQMLETIPDAEIKPLLKEAEGLINRQSNS